MPLCDLKWTLTKENSETMLAAISLCLFILGIGTSTECNWYGEPKCEWDLYRQRCSFYTDNYLYTKAPTDTCIPSASYSRLDPADCVDLMCLHTEYSSYKYECTQIINGSANSSQFMITRKNYETASCTGSYSLTNYNESWRKFECGYDSTCPYVTVAMYYMRYSGGGGGTIDC